MAVGERLGIVPTVKEERQASIEAGELTALQSSMYSDIYTHNKMYFERTD